MVPPRHPKNRAPTASPEDSGQRKYRTSLIETHGIQLAGESQAAGIGKQQSAAATGTPPAIYLYRSPAQAIHGAGQPHYQRRCQEEGVDRQVQEPWDQLGTATPTGQRSRLPQRCRGPGGSLWGLRCEEESRFCSGGHQPRNPGVCGRCHYPLVEELWTQTVPQGQGTVNPGRLGRWQQRSGPRLEIPFTTSTGEPYRLQVTVCHYPPGASKWNPIEHRLFSQISNNWAGRPLESYETALEYIHTTSTATGLAVCARML